MNKITPIIVALSGLKGSFSEEATLTYLKKQGIEDFELMYALDMEGALRALEADPSDLPKPVDLAIFPVVNSVGGLVQTAFEAMGNHRFKMVDKLPFEVNQCLIMRADADPKKISQISSHPQALSQCQNYLATHYPEVHLVEWSDTASAARDLADGTLPEDSAVLASAQAATVYNLKVVAPRIQDHHPNLTTFVIVRSHS